MLKSIKAALRKLWEYDQLVEERDGYRAQLTQLDQLVAERDKYRAQLDQLFVPPGHFASPFPCLDEIRRDEARIFNKMPPAIPAVDLRADEQLQLLREFLEYYHELPFAHDKRDGLRYCYDNPAFSYCDAIVLFCMLRKTQPKRIIEVGSGFSSCVTLDTNDLFFNGGIELTFIEPFPKLLRSLIAKGDEQKARIIPHRLQDVALDEFEVLQANDILFIDSTHVSKIDSDVNYLFFEILPRLASGVLVHIHDIPYPFEYRKAWVYEGRAWNEAYLLRAFLQYNHAYRIVFMNSYMARFHTDFFREHMPLCLKKRGASIWLKKE